MPFDPTSRPAHIRPPASVRRVNDAHRLMLEYRQLTRIPGTADGAAPIDPPEAHPESAEGCTRGRSRSRASELRGFTLIEILVALTILAILASRVYPVIIQHIERAHNVRIATELAAVKTALQSFNLNTAAFPLYLTHLVNPITPSDSTIAFELASPEYSQRQVAGWNGPYLGAHLAASLRVENSIRTGHEGVIWNDLYCYDPTAKTLSDCDPGTFVTVVVDSIRGYEFEAVNEIIDGNEPAIEAPTGSRFNGRLRFVSGGGSDYALQIGQLYFLALPYTD